MSNASTANDRRAEIRARILDVLRDAPEPMTKTEVWFALGMTTVLVESELDRLVDERLVIRRKGTRRHRRTAPGGRSWSRKTSPAVFSLAAKARRRAQ